MAALRLSALQEVVHIASDGAETRFRGNLEPAARPQRDEELGVKGRGVCIRVAKHLQPGRTAQGTSGHKPKNGEREMSKVPKGFSHIKPVFHRTSIPGKQPQM
jgi:hypothetical protein